LKILQVDDEEDVTKEYRDCLSTAGHEVHWVNTLVEAVAVLKEGSSPGFDLVVIDLLLGCDIPPDLSVHYEALRKQYQNEGQALGRWLWLNHGRRQNKRGPMHCYFSSLLHNYQPWKAGTEFDGLGDKASFLISKWSVKPAQMSTMLQLVVSAWQTLPPLK
jgi:CheY-like chemotaxis protein